MSNYYYNGLVQGRTNKYGAKKVTINGEKFDSTAEAERYGQLLIMERAHVISELRKQVKYELVPKQYDGAGKLIEREAEYIADFVYYDSDHNLVVEDVKGYREGAAYNLYKLKRKLMYQKYGIRIKEVKLKK